ncbi:MAG TPA: ribose 5-phosphate isomerase B [Polyangiaceae bacterium]
MTNERIVLGADHGGFELKRELVEGLREGGYPVTDIGTTSAESCDYADFAHAAARGIIEGRYDKAILICGTGVGMNMSANRHPGIRCVNCSDVFTVRYARQHNDANVLAIGGRVVGFGLGWEIVKMFLTTPFSGDKRHVRRISKIEDAG